MKIAKINYLFLILVLAGNLYAMDADLWSPPKLPGSVLVWEDKAVEVNDIKAKVTHFRSRLTFKEIFSFYENNLSSQGWKLERNLTDNIFPFVKDNRYFYVAIQCHAEGQPCDIYLIRSPVDLAICRVLEKYFLKEQIASDVPGKDLIDVLRYPGSKRRLDVLAPEVGGILIYEAEAQPQDIAKFYRQALKQAGWREEQALMAQAVQRLAPQLKDNAVLLFYHADDTLMINVTCVPEKFPGEKTAGRSFIIITKNILQEANYLQSKGTGE